MRIGDVLVDSGAVGRDALEAVAAGQYEGRLGAQLVERGLRRRGRDHPRALSEQLHVPVVDLRDAEPEADGDRARRAARRAPPTTCCRCSFSDGALTVAVADPLDADVMRAAALAAGRRSARRARRADAAAQPRQPDLQRAVGGRRPTSRRSRPATSSLEPTATDRRRRRRARADRPGRQQDRHAGAARPRLRRAHRAGRRLRARALPHRRRAAARSSSCRPRWARRS